MKEYFERDDLKNAKRQKIIQIIEDRNRLTKIRAEQLVKKLEDNKILIIQSPQEDSDITSSMDFFYSIAPREIGSVKFGNIKLNMRSLVFYLAGISTTIAGITTQNIVIFISSLLLLYKETVDLMTISITEEEAIVIYVLWHNCNAVHQIDKTVGYEAVKKFQIENDDIPMERKKYEKCINSLVEIKSIEEIEENKIQLLEWISKDYY